MRVKCPRCGEEFESEVQTARRFDGSDIGRPGMIACEAMKQARMTKRY
jgi:hypothetical protein